MMIGDPIPGPDEEVELLAKGPPSQTAIIVCGILKAEVDAIMGRASLDCPVLPLAPAPCIEYDVLVRQLEGALRRAKDLAVRTLVVIGLCHPDIEAILRHHGAFRLDVRDCFEALLGRSERRRLDGEANIFYTLPAWLPHWRRAFANGMRWDKVDARQNFARYQRILLLDTGLHPIADEQILEFFDFTGVPVEVQPVGLDELAALLLDAIHESQPA